MIMLNNTISLRCRLLAGTALVALTSLFSVPALALDANTLPTGGQIVAGSGVINQSGNTMSVNQASQQMIANWNSFSIGANAQVNFVQPNASSVALNRVIGNDPSQIYGKLTANGKVFLINPSGVLFGQGAQVNVGGIIASTLDIADRDFLAGNYKFLNNGNAGSVVNQGTISVIDKGFAALFGTSVSNQGIITARQGSVVLAAGNAVTLDFNGDGLINLAVNQGTLNALVENKGVIQADGGTVLMSAHNAGDLQSTVVNNSGIIEARAIEDVGGTVVLDGGDSGIVGVSGSIDVSGKGAGQKGGSATVQGDKVGLYAGASIDASGDAGGGTVKVGGGAHGTDSTVKNASATYIDKAATIDVSAKTNGNGGTAIVWSNKYTGFYGSILATGGSQSGNGGFVETSSHNNLQAFGSVIASAPHGLVGRWLLDPEDVTISSSTSGASEDTSDPSYSVFFPTAGNATISAASIAAALATSDVTVNSSTLGSQRGDITIASTIARTSGTTTHVLELDADGSIIFNSNVGITGYSDGAVDVTLKSGLNTACPAGCGSILMNSGSFIKTYGGNVMTGGIGGAANGILPVGGDPTYLRNGITLNGATIDTFSNPTNDTGSAGNIYLYGSGYNATTNDGIGGIGVYITGASVIKGGAIDIEGSGGSGAGSANGATTYAGAGVDIAAGSGSTDLNNFFTIFPTSASTPVIILANDGISIVGNGGSALNRFGSTGSNGWGGGVGVVISNATLTNTAPTGTAELFIQGYGGNGGNGVFDGSSWAATNGNPNYYGSGGVGGTGVVLFNTNLSSTMNVGLPSIWIEGYGGSGGSLDYVNAENYGSYDGTFASPSSGNGGMGVFSANLVTTNGNVAITAGAGAGGASDDNGTITTIQNDVIYTSDLAGGAEKDFVTMGALDVSGRRLTLLLSTDNDNAFAYQYDGAAMAAYYTNAGYPVSKITASELQLLGYYGRNTEFDLFGGANQIGTLSGGSSDRNNNYGPISVYLNNGANNLSIGSFDAASGSYSDQYKNISLPGTSGIYADGLTVDIVTSGTVTETAGSGITADNLRLYGLGGIFNLTQTNHIYSLVAGALSNPYNYGAIAAGKVGSLDLTNGNGNNIYGLGLYVSGVSHLSGNGSVNNNNWAVVTGSLALSGGGSWSITGGNNAIGTLAGAVSSLLLTDSQDLTIGTVYGISGVTASQSESHPIVLSTSGSFTNLAGASGLNPTGLSGNASFIVYSNSTSTIAKGGLTGTDTVPGSYASMPPSHFTSGNQFVFLTGGSGGNNGGGNNNNGGSGSSTNTNTSANNATTSAEQTSTNPPSSNNGSSGGGSSGASSPTNALPGESDKPKGTPTGGTTISGGLIQISATLSPNIASDAPIITLPLTSASLPDARTFTLSSGSTTSIVTVKQSGDILSLSSGTASQVPATGGSVGLGVFSVSGDQTTPVGSFQVGYSVGNLTMTPLSVPVTPVATPTGTIATITFRITVADGSNAEFGLSFTKGALSVRPMNASADTLASSGKADQKLVSATALLQAQQKMGVNLEKVRAVFIRTK